MYFRSSFNAWYNMLIKKQKKAQYQKFVQFEMRRARELDQQYKEPEFEEDSVVVEKVEIQREEFFDVTASESDDESKLGKSRASKSDALNFDDDESRIRITPAIIRAKAKFRKSLMKSVKEGVNLNAGKRKKLGDIDRRRSMDDELFSRHFDPKSSKLSPTSTADKRRYREYDIEFVNTVLARKINRLNRRVSKTSSGQDSSPIKRSKTKAPSRLPKLGMFDSD